MSDGQLYSAGSHHFLALNEKTGAAGFAYIPGQQLTFRGTHAYIATGKEVIAVDREAHRQATLKRQELYATRNSFRSDRAKLAEIDRQMDELAQGGILWKKPFAAESSIALTGNAVLVGGMDEVRAFDLDDGREVWTAKARRRGPRPGGGWWATGCQHHDGLDLHICQRLRPPRARRWSVPPQPRPKHSPAMTAASSTNRPLERFWPIAA